MKQKLALCCALIHRPEVLLLDEPGTGVDPVSRKEFWDMLKRLKGWGITILVSTPYMDEAGLCDRVGLIQKGRIMAIDTPEAIARSYKHPLFAVRADDMYRLVLDLRAMDDAVGCYTFGADAHLSLRTGKWKEANIEQYLAAKGHRDIHVQATAATIEDCFIELMKD
jgi:ABC-type multidrug transport system ATPase subunit